MLSEKLLLEGNPLLAINKSTEGRPTERNPILGQSFPLYKNQATFHWDLIIIYTHLNWDKFHLLFLFGDTIFSIWCCTSQSSSDLVIHSTIQMNNPLHLALPQHTKIGAVLYRMYTLHEIFPFLGAPNDNISKGMQSQFLFKPHQPSISHISSTYGFKHIC